VVLNLKDVLESIIVDEPNSNLGIFATKSKSIIEEIANSRDMELYEFKNIETRRFPYIGEFFENIYLEGENFFENENFLKEISRTIQKNRTLILNTEVDLEVVINAFEKFDFSDFNQFDFDGGKIIVTKRWFKW
jgi:hypothetical protein